MALAFLRRHQRWFHVLLGLVILGFIFVYIPSFRNAAAGGDDSDVGRVAELPITAREYQTAYQRLRSRYEQMYQTRLDANMIKMLGLGNQVFDGLVEQRIVELEARRHGLVVTDRELAMAASNMPYFQDQGRFIGADRVRQALESQGQSVEDFERALRHDLLRKQLEALVTDGVTVSASEIEDDYKRRNEEIKAEYVLVDTARFTAQATATDEDIKARFEADKEAYRIPDKRVASYAFVDPQALRSQIAVTDTEIAAHYKDHPDQYSEQEQVCAQHILIKAKDATAKEGRTDAEAKTAATAILAQLRGGADFATVAKKSSEDTGSAAKGGDLGCFPRHTMVDEFENVAFSAKPGELSEPVKTQYGYHIIKVTEKREGKVKPLETVKEAIRAELSSARAQTMSEQKSQALAAALSHGAKLEDTARANGVPVQTSAPVGRGEPLPPFNEEVVARLFELKPGETTPQPIALRGGFIFLTLTETKPSRLPELAEVKDRVKADLLKDKALEMAKSRAQELKAKADAQGLDKAASALGLVRKDSAFVKRGEAIGDVPSGPALDAAAFALAPNTVSEPIPVTNGFAVLRVVEKKAIDPAAFEKEKGSIAASLRSAKRSQLFEAYIAQVRQRFPIERNAEVLNRFAS
jgi:peptidyl-prolyl cis-trans isomerase D